MPHGAGPFVQPKIMRKGVRRSEETSPEHNENEFETRRLKMRIEFVRTGGFTGMRMAANIDSETLPPDEARELLDELDSADFFSLPVLMTGESGGADRFEYEITIDTGDRQHTVQAGDASLPDRVQPLVHHLERLARSRRRPG